MHILQASNNKPHNVGKSNKPPDESTCIDIMQTNELFILLQSLSNAYYPNLRNKLQLHPQKVFFVNFFFFFKPLWKCQILDNLASNKKAENTAT